MSTSHACVFPHVTTQLLFTEKYDLVFSNAAMHWIPDQSIMVDALTNLVRPGTGVLAVQMPDTRVQPSHLLMEVAAHNCGYTEAISNVRIPRTEHDPDYYLSMLSPHSSSVDLWSTDYVQQLPYFNTATSHNGVERVPSSEYHPVLEFTSATGLLPVLEAIEKISPEDGKSHVQRYLSEYNRLLHEAYPPHSFSPNNSADSSISTVVFPFKRFFFVAKRI